MPEGERSPCQCLPLPGRAVGVGTEGGPPAPSWEPWAWLQSHPQPTGELEEFPPAGPQVPRRCDEGTPGSLSAASWESLFALPSLSGLPPSLLPLCLLILSSSSHRGDLTSFSSCSGLFHSPEPQFAQRKAHPALRPWASWDPTA